MAPWGVIASYFQIQQFSVALGVEGTEGIPCVIANLYHILSRVHTNSDMCPTNYSHHAECPSVWKEVYCTPPIELSITSRLEWLQRFSFGAYWL